MHRLLIPDEVRGYLRPWYNDEFINDTEVVEGSLIGWLFGCLGKGAVTINRRVHFTPRGPDLASRRGIVLLGHEYYHVRQQCRMGWLPFLARYIWHWRPAYIKEGRRHPMERPAYDRAELIRGYIG